MIAGGYLGFQGFQARANFARSALAPALPVLMVDYDDREETSAAALVHPVGESNLAALITFDVPVLLGYNRVNARIRTRVHAIVGEDALIATSDYGKGRTLVWTRDIGAHWCPNEFVDVPGYSPLMAGMIQWLADKKRAH